MAEDDFERRIKSYSLSDLLEAHSGLDKEKYPERAEVLKRAIADHVAIHGSDSDNIAQTMKLYEGKKFFAKSMATNLVLSIASLNIYQFIWMYKSWKRCKQIEQSKISPLWRSFFYTFTSYFLFSRMRESANRNNCKVEFQPVTLASLVLATRFNYTGDSAFFQNLALILFVLSVVLANVINGIALKINAATESSETNYEGVTFFEQVIVAFGLLIWLFLVFAHFDS